MTPRPLYRLRLLPVSMYNCNLVNRTKRLQHNFNKIEIYIIIKSSSLLGLTPYSPLRVTQSFEEPIDSIFRVEEKGKQEIRMKHITVSV
jgi:hypothetical protein